MTRFALLTEFFPPDHGGIQATLGPLAATFGDEITVVAPQVDTNNQHAVRRSLFSGRSWPRWLWLVGWFHKAHRQGLEEAIFGHFSAATIAGYFAARLFGLRYSILIHGNDLLTEERRWLSHLFISRVLRHATTLGVNSAFVYRQVIRFGVPESRVIYSHPFVLNKYCQHRPIDVSTAQRLITVARLVPRKNVQAVIAVLGRLIHSWPDIHLDIVGDGPERVALEQQAGSLGLTRAITFHGTVSETTKWSLLQQANIFLMVPTVRDHGTDVEGLGLVYLEAMAAGLPIVASGTGGIQDAVKNGINGFTVNPHSLDAIERATRTLLTSPEQAQRFGRTAQNAIQQEFTDLVRLGRLRQRLLPSPTTAVVSIIIPAYQASDTILETLQSVFSQTYQHLEVIVVDDGSTDNIHELLQAYTSSLKFIQQSNAGAPVARNTGFDESRGKYVLFLDADTILQQHAVSSMVAVLETRPDISYVYSDFNFGWKNFHLHNFDSKSLKQMNYIHTTSLLRREDFPRFDPTLKKFQDWDLWLTMDEREKWGAWLPETLFTVQPRRKGIAISSWLPSFMYSLPIIGRGKGNTTIAKYRAAEAVIRQKHGI